MGVGSKLLARHRKAAQSDPAQADLTECVAINEAACVEAGEALPAGDALPAGEALPAAAEGTEGAAPMPSPGEIDAFVARCFGGATVAREAMQAALVNYPPAPIGGSDVGDPDSLESQLFWAARLASITGEVPAPVRTASPLQALRDAGNEAAGELYRILGDGARLPDLPANVIGAAATFALVYCRRQTAALERGETIDRDWRLGWFDHNLTDLFLRCIGVRRELDRCDATMPFHNEAALFFRKLYDLGGLG